MVAFLRNALRYLPPLPSPGWSPFSSLGSLSPCSPHGSHDLCIGLVNDSSIDLDLYHVQGIGAFGVAALFAIALLLGAWCLVASAVVDLVVPSTHMRPAVVAASASLVISVVAHHWFGIVDTVLFLWPAPVFIVFAFARQRTFTFLYGVVVIGLLAGTSTHILTKYMHNREQRERVVLAERLAGREDPVVEQLFRETAPALRTDTAVYRLLMGPSVCLPGELEAIVRQRYFSGYWDRYDIRLFGFGPRAMCAAPPIQNLPAQLGDGTLLPRFQRPARGRYARPVHRRAVRRGLLLPRAYRGDADRQPRTCTTHHRSATAIPLTRTWVPRTTPRRR